MRLDEFRERVTAVFGPRLERATPATVEEFLERIAAEIGSAGAEDEPFTVDESAKSWEQVIHEFLGVVLEQPTESRFVQLWLLGLMLHFQALNEAYDDQFEGLFRPTSDAGSGD